jgi:hypothetical protein
MGMGDHCDPLFVWPMSSRVHDFISAIRSAETGEEERILIVDEVAHMRTMIRDCPTEDKPGIIAKLLFLNISGENTAWGHMEAVSLMSHERLSYKRLGYLAVSLFIDEDAEILVLLTQTITTDLQCTNPLVQAYALSFLANHASTELLQSVHSDIERLVESPHPGVQKRAGVAAIRVIRRIPELSQLFRKCIPKLMGSPKHAVVSAGILLVTEMIRIDPGARESWRGLAKPLTKLLKVLAASRPSNEFRLSTFNDPFLQIKAMQLLGELQIRSDELDDVLTSLVTAVDIRRNTGRSILFQAVATIATTAKKGSLCGLAFNQIGRLFSFRDPNVLYSALAGFSQVLYNGREIVDRSSRDSVALQRYKSEVVHCLDHRDPSVRRRALDVVLALVDGTNAETLIPEIIEFLHFADRDFRVEMVSKIYSAVQRFAPTAIWNFDTVHLLLIDSGPFVGTDLIASFCTFISREQAVRDHAIPRLANTMSGYGTNQALVQVASWVIGQFLTIEDCQLIDVMVKILGYEETAVETKCYLITAITKLAARFRRPECAVPVLDALVNDGHFEVQQRAGEMRHLLSRPDIWETTLAIPDCPQEDEQQQQTATIVSIPNQAPTDDLLSLDVKSPAVTPEEPLVELRSPPNAREALRTTDFVIFFEIQRNAANPRQLAIRSTIYNLTRTRLTQFTISYGVPMGWVVRAPQLKGETLEKNGERPIQHVLVLENRGTAPLMMKTHASYMFGCQPLTSDDTLNPIFD